MNVDQQKISELLFELDPMMTCCKENDCFEEYDMVSKFIMEDVNNDVSLREASKRAFQDLFDEDVTNRMDLDLFQNALANKN